MAGGGLTNKDVKKLKSKINDSSEDPAVRKQLEDMLNFLTQPQQTQEEVDRRWSNLCAYLNDLQEDQKPTTLGGHRDVLAKFGLILNTKMTQADAARPGHFGDFMQSYGAFGWKIADSYEMKGQEDAKPRCDHCKKVGATMRCRKCREWYCSHECQKAGWPDHKPICKLVAEERTYS